MSIDDGARTWAAGGNDLVGMPPAAPLADLAATADMSDFEFALVEPQTSAVAFAGKRVIDIAIAFLTMLLLAPVMVLVSVGIKLTSRGPVFFRQDRVGKDGVLFLLYKFRTMRDGAHQRIWNDPQHRAMYVAGDFKLPSNSSEITSLGRWLRCRSLDELPQLINVLLGDMSVVGVRPLLEPELALRPMIDQRLYATMRPGMTGLWQVEGRSRLTKVTRVGLDRQYIEDWSLLSDVAILMRTPAAVFRHQDTR